MTRSLPRNIRRWAILAASALVPGCNGDGPTGADDPGTLRVVARTTGEGADGNGYMVAVDGGATQAIGVNGTLLITGLAPRDHEVELSDVAANCAVESENPRTVLVKAAGTSELTFQVSCAATAGAVRVAVSSAEFPVRGVGVTVTGPGGQRGGMTNEMGTVTILDVEPGEVTVNARVGNVACTPAVATVRRGATTEVEVDCAPGTVTGRVTIDGVGAADVIVWIFISATMTAVDGRYEFTGAVGMWSVGIIPPEGVACPVTMQTFTLSPGRTVTIDFACTR